VAWFPRYATLILLTQQGEDNVPDEKDYSLGGADRAEWDRLWSARRQRLLPGECKLDMGRYRPSLKLTAFTIADDPPEFTDRVRRTSETCPVCGEWTSGHDRIGASLDVTFETGLSFGMGVWVHPACFETCTDTGGPAHIPW
jgi:hypothetical protein